MHDKHQEPHAADLENQKPHNHHAHVDHKVRHDGNTKESDELARLQRQNETLERNLRLKAWHIGIPALATLACVLCLYACENCLIGVMLFCAVLCCKDWVLVLVFCTSLVLLLIRHPPDTGTVHHLTNAAIALARAEQQ